MLQHQPLLYPPKSTSELAPPISEPLASHQVPSTLQPEPYTPLPPASFAPLLPSPSVPSELPPLLPISSSVLSLSPPRSFSPPQPSSIYPHIRRPGPRTLPAASTAPRPKSSLA